MGRRYSGHCARCQQQFTRVLNTGDIGKYCSRECAFAQWKDEAEQARRADALMRAQKSAKKCRNCGCDFVSLRSVVCSASCRKAEAAAYMRALYQATKKLKPREERPCAVCQRLFASNRSNAKYCSRACSRKALGNHNHFERAKRHGVKRDYSVTPIRVFERDGWKCQLCGTPTPASAKGRLKRNSPELDHVIPLSQGGGHTWDNVQCACRACNAAKGARPFGQLRLAV